MVKGKITFIQCYDYEVKGETEQDCFEEAYRLFKNDMYRPIARTGYDEVEEEYTEDDEEDIDDANVATRESLGNNWW